MKLKLFALLLSLVSLSTNCYADNYTDEFCVVPIKNVPSYDDSLFTSRLVEDRWQLSGIEQPLYVNSLNQQATYFGTWTINKDREFVPYNHPAPTHPWDEYIEEPWSGRVVFNRNAAKKQLLALEQGQTLFKALDQSKLKGRTFFKSLATLSIAQETIVFTQAGIPYQVGKDSLKPWPTYQKIRQQGVSFKKLGYGGREPIYDAPALGGFIVASDTSELFLYSDNKLEKIKIGTKDGIQKAVNLIDQKMFVFVTSDELIHVVQRSDEGQINVRSYTLSVKSGYIYLKNIGQFIWYDASISRWVRLTRKGFEPIPIQSDVSIPQSATITEMPHLNMALLDTRNAIFQYDGIKFIKILTYPNPQQYYSKVFPLPSIEKALLLTHDNRLYSFDKNKPLTEVKTTVDLSSFQTSIIDWPNAKSALLLNDSGIYTVDKNLATKRIHGGDTFTSNFSNAEHIGHNNVTGELYLSNRRGFFAVVDKKVSGHAVCDYYDVMNSKIPKVQLCINPIKQSKIKDIGLLLSEGKPSSNGDGVFFDAVKGVHYVDQSNTILNIDPQNDGSQASDEGFVPIWWMTGAKIHIEWDELKRIFNKPSKPSELERIKLFDGQFEASKKILTASIFDVNDKTTVVATTDGAYIKKPRAPLKSLLAII
ncbi:hypothetical protein [Methylotenera sp.]|uniref:hypothetical protein n=1 Tax=Methylotenera sp. TaxID=2051956 RepID=UPI00248A6221|nr:hypothetical protein [Methylotenera sp.]MDI1298969.1 hypothetical protein [Methylotenera sp.]